MRRTIGWWMIAVCLLAPVCVLAQSNHDSLTEQEIEEVREYADYPPKRIQVFIKIVDTRVDKLRDLLSKKYEQGRAEDIQDLMRQVADICNELTDNLGDYDGSHKDMRKVLPKIGPATEKWASVLRQVEKNDKWELTRSLALDSVADLKKEAEEDLPKQVQWFKEHPPSKEPETTPGPVNEH